MHTQALSDRLLLTADAGLQATFSCVFQSISWLFPPYEQHIFVHDKISLCFLRLTDLSIHKQRKTQASWVSATDSYGEKITSCPPAAFRASSESRVCKQPITTPRFLAVFEGYGWCVMVDVPNWMVKLWWNYGFAGTTSSSVLARLSWRWCRALRLLFFLGALVLLI